MSFGTSPFGTVPFAGSEPLGSGFGDGDNDPIKKKVFYKIYTPAGQYITTWEEEVLSDIDITQKMNTVGSELILVLGRIADNFGEGYDVNYFNRVEVWVADTDLPNGYLYMNGFISQYEPNFNAETVTVKILGIAFKAADYILEGGEAVDQIQLIINDELGFGQTDGITTPITSMITGGGVTNMSGWEFKMRAKDASYLGKRVKLDIFDDQTDAENIAVPATPLGTAYVTIDSIAMKVFRFGFPEPLGLSATTEYFGRLSVVVPVEGDTPIFLGYRDDDAYGGNIFEWYDEVTDTWTGDVFWDPYFKTYKTPGNTRVPFNSVDPSDIWRAVIDDLSSRGCPITYTDSSIEDTGTEVSYEFNLNNGHDALDKVLELCPADWYYWVDQSKYPAVFHAHPKPDFEDYQFTLGKEIKGLQIRKSVERITNVVYFKGMPDAISGENLLKKFVLASSVDDYGEHAVAVSDERVNDPVTAEIMATANYVGTPVIDIVVEVIDNTLNAVGYDVENMILGRLASIKGTNIDNQQNQLSTGGSLFDQAAFDLGYFDYNPLDLSNVKFQVTGFQYKGDVLLFSLSTARPDVKKRTQDIKRNLKSLQFVNNPTAPA